MYNNGKMTMTFGQATQIQQQRQLQIQQQQIQERQIQEKQALITTQPRTRGFRPMLLGQNNKKGGCKSCGSA